MSSVLEDRSGYAADHVGALVPERPRSRQIRSNATRSDLDCFAPGADLRAPRVRLPSSTRTGLPRRRLAILSGKTIDQTRKVLAKLGDFDGIDKNGVPQGLLFPASPAFSLDGRSLYVTNLALDLRLAVSPDVQAIDSQWTDQVKSYTVSKLSTNFKPLGQGH